MRFLFSGILLINAVLGLLMTVEFMLAKRKKHKRDYLFMGFAMSSALWSFSFSMMYLQDTVLGAYFWRSLGIAGTFLFMITVQELISDMSGIHKWIHRTFAVISYLGLSLFVMSIQPNQTTYEMTDYGMSYQFVPGPVSYMYVTYFVIVTVNILAATVFMIVKAEKKRSRVFGIRFVWMAILVSLGTILDVGFPIMGLPAIPGSSVTQFWGLVCIWLTLKMVNDTSITSSNMAGYIYYSIDIPVIVYDDDEKIQLMNDAAGAFFGVNTERASLGDMEFGDFFDSKERKIFQFNENSRKASAVCKKNKAKCELSVSKIIDRYGDLIGHIMIVNDVTEKEMAMQRLEEAKREADTANHAKSAFLANMSHEIRTPMNAIIGFSELALHEGLPKEAEEDVISIKNSSQSLLSIINEILDISKIESGKMELVCDRYDTNELFRGVYQLIKTQADGKELAFSMDIDPAIPSGLYGDSTRIREILINLLNNAVKYTHKGKIVLRVELIRHDNQTAVLKMIVSDSGMGIKKESIPYLFDSFTRVDTKANSKIEGTGLGLAIVKGYVELMGGKIYVESIYGQGSSFFVELPQEISNPSPIKIDLSVNAKLNSDYVITRKIYEGQVLVVDDNAVNRSVIKKSMLHYGMKVDVAESGLMAIELCRNKQYDIVFMDQMMPEMDGVTCMKRLRNDLEFYAHGGGSKIVALTANAIIGVKEELLQLGFDDYLEKPMKFPELERVLDKFLKKNAASEDIEQKSDSMPEKVMQESLQTTEMLQTEDNSIEEKVMTAEELVIPGVDTAEGLERCANDVDTYLEVLGIIAGNAQNDVDKLRSLAAAGDFKNYTIHAHGIKGALMNVGVGYTAELARELEYAGRREDAAYIAANNEPFIVVFLKLIEQFKKVLPVKQMDKAGVKLADLAQELKDAGLDDDYATVQLVLDRVEPSKLSDSEKEIYDRIKDAFDEVDGELIAAICDELL